MKVGGELGKAMAMAMAEVEAVYAELEVRSKVLVRDCAGRTECCRFLLTGKTPMLTAGEALVAAEGVRASGRKKVPEVQGKEGGAGDGRCPLLGANRRCSIYRHRPFGCRTHFCAAAGGAYPREAVRDLIQRLEVVGEMLGDSDVRAISNAVEDAMAKLRPQRGR